jgi:hypothetical protein
MISDIFSRNEIVLGPLRQIPPGEGRNFEVNGQRIAVFHTRAGEVQTLFSAGDGAGRIPHARGRGRCCAPLTIG